MEKNKLEELLEKVNDSITKGKALINDLENQKSILNSMLEENELNKEESIEVVEESKEEVIEEAPQEEKTMLDKLHESTVKFSSVQRMLSINKMKALIVKNKFKNSLVKKEEVQEEVVEEAVEKTDDPAKGIMEKLAAGAKITGARAVGVPHNKISLLKGTFIEKLSDAKNNTDSVSSMLGSILETKQAKTM